MASMQIPAGRHGQAEHENSGNRIDDNCIDPQNRDNHISMLTSYKGEKLIVGTSCRFRIGPNDQWQLITVAREADVVRDQRRNAWLTAQEQLVVIACVLVLIFLFSWRITRNIELVSSSFTRVGELRLDAPPATSLSHLREVAVLQNGLLLLIESLRAFARFVPDDLVRRIAYSGQGFTETVAETEITIFFCDIAGFTSMAECQPLEETLSHLRSYFNLVCHEVNREGGTVDKFIGNAVMAFWGAPESQQDHAIRAARTALRVQQAIRAYSRSPDHETEPELRVRIGLHTATVLVGTIGSSDRLSYTAIGDGVNIASRLEGLNKDLGTEICISEAMLQACDGQLQTRCLGPQHLRGRGTVLNVYELLAIAQDEPAA